MYKNFTVLEAHGDDWYTVQEIDNFKFVVERVSDDEGEELPAGQGDADSDKPNEKGQLWGGGKEQVEDKDADGIESTSETRPKVQAGILAEVLEPVRVQVRSQQRPPTCCCGD